MENFKWNGKLQMEWKNADEMEKNKQSGTNESDHKEFNIAQDPHKKQQAQTKPKIYDSYLLCWNWIEL